MGTRTLPVRWDWSRVTRRVRGWFLGGPTMRTACSAFVPVSGEVGTSTTAPGDVGALVHDARMEMWSCEFDAELWIWEASPAAASWVFLTVPEDETEEIGLRAGPPHGFGSVRVEASIGGSTWRTSVFPDKTRGFVLPVKRAVRRAESLDIGDSALVRLTLIDS
jgi:uncharacterized protein DUF1905